MNAGSDSGPLDPPGLVAPADLSPRPHVLVPALAEQVGEAVAAAACADLLTGADPASYAVTVHFLGGRPAPSLLAGAWKPYWARVWGARGLLYVWDDAATDAVLAGLRDEHWRIAEMCVKVAGRRDLGQSGDAVATLAGHDLARVRLAVVRALRDIGDTHHVPVVEAARHDPEEGVRTLAFRVLPRMRRRLDLPD